MATEFHPADARPGSAAPDTAVDNPAMPEAVDVAAANWRENVTDQDYLTPPA